MSISKTYDQSRTAVLNPSDVHIPKRDFPEVVLVTFKAKILKVLLDHFETEIIAVMNGGMDIPIYKFEYEGKTLAMYHTTIGGSATVALMEEVIAMGGKKFVVFGSCGTLDRDIAAGHLIVPTDAYRDEGTSYHYLPDGDYVKVATAERTAQILDEINAPYSKTKVWTTDGLYRETRKNMDARKSEGCLVVDMECASVMALGLFRDVPMYQYLYGEDTLDGDKWDKRTMDHVPQSDNEKYLQIAMDIAVRV